MDKLDARRIKQALTRAAPEFDTADFFHAEIRTRLLDRLDLISMIPEQVIDLGTGTGDGARALHECFADACVLGVDPAPAMLRQAGSRCPNAVCATASRLPLPDHSVDLVFSSLALHWFDDLPSAAAEVRRVLDSPGLFTFTALGEQSFHELRSVWAQVDDYPHVHEFPNMHALGDMLIAAGFREPVLDTESLTVTYADPASLVRDLRAVGATNSSRGRKQGLTGRDGWGRMVAHYGEFRDGEGRYPVTLDVIYGQAWAGSTLPGVALNDGEAGFPVSRLRRRR